MKRPNGQGYLGSRIPMALSPEDALLWKLIDSYEDTDTGTGFDTGTISFTTYNIVKVVLNYQEHSGAANSLYLRVNGLSTADYEYVERSGTTWTTHSGATEWELVETYNEPISGTILLRGGNLAANPPQNRPVARVLLGLSQTKRVMAVGRNVNDITDLTDLRIWGSSGAGTGRVKIYGTNL